MTLLHKIYLPFSVETFKKHFIKFNDLVSIEKLIKKYKESIDKYSLYETNKPFDNIKSIRQIEKDETFWTASSLMTIFHSSNRNFELQELLTIAFGEKPPLENFSSWKDCLGDDLSLFFEPYIPSPKGYCDWLKNNIPAQNFIPYIIDSAKNKNGDYRSDLEGNTNVDALLLNSTNGFAVFIEAKVLSDISYLTTYNSMRNQIIRNIDVMLSSNSDLTKPLNNRKPDNTLFLLITPQIFKNNPKTRLYGYVFEEYKTNPQQIGKDLAYRNLSRTNCEKISNRIGWITWEDLKEINNDCCKWLKTK